MKAKRLIRNRTRRRIQRGGYNITRILDNIRVIRSSTKNDFREGRKSFNLLYQEVTSPEFQQAFSDKPLIIRIVDGMRQHKKLLDATTDNKSGYGQKTSDPKNSTVFIIQQHLQTLYGVLTSLPPSDLQLSPLPPLPPSPPLEAQAAPPPPPLALAEPSVEEAVQPVGQPQAEQQAAPVEALPSPPAQEPVEEAVQPVGEPQPEEEAAPAEIADEEFEDDSDDESDDEKSAIIQDAIRKQFPGSRDVQSVEFLKNVHNWSEQDKLKKTKDWVVATTRRAIEFAASRCNSRDAVIVNRRKKVLLDLLATFNDKYTDEQFAQKVRLVLRTTIQAVKSANEQSGISNIGTSFQNENELSRRFVRELIFLMISRNQRELRFRTAKFGQLIYRSFHREPWCYKQDLADVTKQEFLRDKFGAKWINDSKQGLILTSKSSVLSSTLPKTMTISRGDCFSFTPAAFKIFFPGASDPKKKYFIDITSQKNNQFTVSNITELLVGFNLTIFNTTSGSIVKDSRLELKLTNYEQINSFVNGITKKECPKGVGLTPVLPDDCQIKLAAQEFKSRNFERQASTCETELARLREQLNAAMQKNKSETERLQGIISQEQLKLAGLQASKTEVEQNLTAATKAERTLREHIGRYGRELGEFRTKVDNFQKSKLELDAQIGVLRSELGASNSLNEERQAEIGRLTEMYTSIMARLAETMREQDQSQAKYAETTAKLQDAEASVADLNSRFATTDALITTSNERILSDLEGVQDSVTEGVEELAAGLDQVVSLAETTNANIAKARGEFTAQFDELQRKLTMSNLEGRKAILDAIQILKQENQASMSALQRDLAAASTEKERLQAEIAREKATTAQVQGELKAKTEEMARRAQENAAALAAVREAATRSAEEAQAANQAANQTKDEATAAEARRLQESHASKLEELGRSLAVALARATVAENATAERQALAKELASVRAQIAAIPPPVAAAPRPVAPKITGREPPVGTPAPEGSTIKILWDPSGTSAPWILRIDYNGTTSDFQEITAAGPIVYKIKSSGELSGRIYSVTEV
jgi:hypothetical protein